ncbi:cysteine hydrolase [Siphonobacter sp. SORGH_AS_0500]|uniref:cysteine hydrolase family protein n=1 Tax=Siphonobacter sp. SORGH_AS_0500 TaxID=1864824 RepID=UPI000CBF4EBF|nr:cysteine hydrolase family protein [Siphonobacter sp. SORGH_AS_0500]PKK36729.1 cysteine hydrolase [Siphonobacter sp. SORGH_AS_0500]
MKTALILIDIQNDYFPNGANELVGSEEASLRAREILTSFRKKNDLVVHIQHVSTRAGSTFFLPDTFGAEMHEHVKPLENEKVIIKHYPNSFRETELLVYLKENDINHLVIAGMMTHMCVDATVRAAKDLGYTIEVIADACATKDLEVNEIPVKAKDVQTAFLAGLNYFYATVRTTKDYLGHE